MDPIIISAIITALASALVGFLSLKGSKSSPAPTLRDIRLKQLDLLFEPICQKFLTVDRSNPDDCKSTVHSIYQIVTSNLRLVPPFLLKEVIRIEQLPVIEYSDMEKLEIMNLSLYNWHCKYFGYPYEADKIIRKYAPMYNRYLFFRMHINKLVYLIPTVTLLLCLSPLSSVENPQPSGTYPGYVVAASFMVIVLAIIAVIYSFINDRE